MNSKFTNLFISLFCTILALAILAKTQTIFFSKTIFLESIVFKQFNISVKNILIFSTLFETLCILAINYPRNQITKLYCVWLASLSFVSYRLVKYFSDTNQPCLCFGYIGKELGIPNVLIERFTLSFSIFSFIVSAVLIYWISQSNLKNQNYYENV